MIKAKSLLTKTFWLGLIVTTAMAVALFNLSPSFAHSTHVTTMGSTPKAALMALDDASESSLYKRLGGYNKIARIIDRTLENVLNDQVISKYFIGLSTNSTQRLRQLLVDQFCQAAGGPCVYTGRTMKLSHSGIGGGLTNDEFNAFASDVSSALDRSRVEQQEKSEVLAFVESLRGQIVER